MAFSEEALRYPTNRKTPCFITSAEPFTERWIVPMNECKVTVIVGIYNSAQFLRKGLRSISNQTWTNFEALLMDDGSTDESGKICDEFAAKDSRFIAVHKPNSGVCDSRNKGLEMATGDYVCFMDGDDWFSDDLIEYIMSIIIKTGTMMALSDMIFTTNDQIQNNDDTIEIWDSEKTIISIIYPYIALGPWNKIYSLNLIRENNIRFPEHWFGETLHFANTVSYYSERIGVGHRKVYNYRLDNLNSGTTQLNVSLRLLSIDNAINLRKAIFADNPRIRNAIEWHLYANYFDLLVNIIACNSELQYEKEYREAKAFMKNNWFNVLVHSEVKPKDRIKIVIKAFFPQTYAKRIIRKIELSRRQQEHIT